MNKNANSADVRRLTRPTQKAWKSLAVHGSKKYSLQTVKCVISMSIRDFFFEKKPQS